MIQPIFPDAQAHRIGGGPIFVALFSHLREHTEVQNIGF